MGDALEPNFRGLIYVLAGVLVREVEREVREQSEESARVVLIGDNQTESARASHAREEGSQAT
jgi:hypothetical protein